VRQKDGGKKMKGKAFSCRHLFAFPEFAVLLAVAFVSFCLPLPSPPNFACPVLAAAATIL
jgi:hypothetical protein